MSEAQEPNFNLQSGTPRWLGIVVVLLAVVSVVSLGMAWSASNHARSVEATTNAAVKQNIEALNQRSAETNAQVQSDLRTIAEKLQLTEGQLAAARKQNKTVGAQFDKKLSAVESSVKSELATKASTEDVSKLNGDVTGVKTDLDATKNSVQMARGELGTLIARNHEEIDQLRRTGQRDYFEFTLNRKAGPQKVGDVQVELRGTNTKKNQFTVIVHADDSRFEKKNRSVNEPIYFYTNGSRSALELVVNKVAKDRATGYLSVPKAQPAAAATSGSSSGQ